MNSLHDMILATLRQHVLMHIVGNPLFKPEQQQQTARRVACCCDRHTLSRWIVEARQEAHSRRACHKASQEISRELAAVTRYVQTNQGKWLQLSARQYLQPGQILRFALNQN
jgi:hypothetical protein